MEHIWSVIHEYIVPLGVTCAVGIGLAPIIIPFLRRLKFGQSIRDIGPSWHKGKSGTPTMGGIVFIISVVAVTLFLVRQQSSLVVIAAAAAFGIIGFIDDYIKVVLKRNLGLKSLQKLILQIAAAVGFVVALTAMDMIPTSIMIPFSAYEWELGWLFVPFSVFIMVGFTNAVNLTDGLDGLASLVTSVVSLFFAVAAHMLNNTEIAMFCFSLTGGCLAFYVYNRYPAKVFMGDTGSLFLGGALAASAIVLRMPLILIIAGIIYVIETLSVMMQVTSFKLTGKRIFKMSPIHHHFEMVGWSEKKIVAIFSIVTVAACVVAYLAM